MKKIIFKLDIDHNWFIWEPKKGNYKGLTKYISTVSSFGRDKYLDYPVVLGGYRVRDGSPHMHVHSMTHYQIIENTRPLKDKFIIKEMENKFIEYKKKWEERSIVNTAKQLLIN